MARNRRRGGESAVSLFSFQDIIAGVTGIMVVFTLILVVELMTRTMAKGEESPEDVEDLIEQVAREREELAALNKKIDETEKELNESLERGAFVPADVERQKEKLKRIQDRNKRAKLALSEGRAELASAEDALKREAASEDALAKKIRQANDDAAEESKKARVTVRGGIDTEKTPYVVECDKNEVVVGEMILFGDGAHEVKELKRFAGGPDKASQSFGAWLNGRDPKADRFSIVILPDGLDSFQNVRNSITEKGFEFGYDPALPQSRAFPKP